MADAVRGNAVILYVQLGEYYYPIACSKDVSITTTSDFLELAPRSSSIWREFIPSRISGQITGNGITKIVSDSLYSVFDLMGYQFDQTPVLAKFELTDPSANIKVFECETLVEECNVSGEAGRLSNHSYSLKITGPVTMSTTDVEEGPPTVVVGEGETDFDAEVPEDRVVSVIVLIGTADIDALKIGSTPGGDDLMIEQPLLLADAGKVLSVNYYTGVSGATIYFSGVTSSLTAKIVMI
jgi:hypothetical protein